MCDYRVNKQITLQKHINTTHSKNYIPERKASKLEAFSYFCDECEYAYHNMKSLKKHKAQNHEGQNHLYNTCEKNVKYKKER